MKLKKEITNKLVIAISSRALFNLDESHQVYEQQGLKAYADYQIEHEDVHLQPGSAFPLVKKLLALSDPKTNEPLVEIILLSRNSADTGLRIFNSIKHYQLDIKLAAFTSGENPYQYVPAFAADLFLSTNPDDVLSVLQAGYAAATICTNDYTSNCNEQLRIAFDGDAVIFSDESERIYQKHGLTAFTHNETHQVDTPIPGGPFKGFLQALHSIQRKFPAKQCPIRTALVTARSAPAHERVVRTLRAWNIRIDEALFLGGLDKGEFLKAFQADFFFDDHPHHCHPARKHVATGHVPNGINNQETADE